MFDTLVFDTEFVWVPGLERLREDGTQRTPHPPNASVESIAYVAIDHRARAVALGTIDAEREDERVWRLMVGFEAFRLRLVTFGGRGSDVPLLLARAMKYGMTVPRFARCVARGPRYELEHHVDLHDLLGSFGAQRLGSLSDWARCCGWPGKGDVDGSKVAEMIAQGRRDEVDAYCLSDAVQAAVVLLHYEMASGRIVWPAFEALGKALVMAAGADGRLTHLMDARRS